MKNETEPLKIKVIKCSNKILWYSDYVGQEFRVLREEKNAYWCREGGVFNCLNWIAKEDAQLIE